MASNGIDFYHWGIVVYLAWLSSAVHIASLTVLGDIFNENPRLRNIRDVGMLALLAVLTTAMWPLRGDIEVASWVSVKCLWDQPVVRASRDYAFTNGIYLNWVLPVIMLFGAYIWKLSQLFASSRGWVRKWLRAKPEVAQERLLRRIAKSNRNAWLKWPAYKTAVVCYVVFVVWAEFAESYLAMLVYLCLTLPWGVVNITYLWSTVDVKVRSDEAHLSFGQLVPLLLLLLPILYVLELSAGECYICMWDRRVFPEADAIARQSKWKQRPKRHIYPRG